MVEAVIGKVLTFQVLFVGADNTPIAVNNPTIDVFMFSQLGVLQGLVGGQAMSPVTPVETGRYVYPYTIPTTLTDGDLIHAEVVATEPGTGRVLRAYQEVTVVSSNRGLGGSPGMTARFF